MDDIGLEVNKIHCMDALTFLRQLKDKSVHCGISSPPYYGLRDYGVDGQLGLEQTPQEYIKKLVDIFREFHRVLLDDGTLWVNLGDSYANDEKRGSSTGGKHAGALHGSTGVGRGKKSTGLPPKSRMMIPARFAIAMQDDGWILRDEIIWHKSNPMPESVTDRTTKAHEMIYMFAKSGRYYYDQEAIKEPANYDGRKDTILKGSDKYKDGVVPGTVTQTMSAQPTERWQKNADGEYVRNRRSVWTVTTKPLKEAHFAAFPFALIEPMILAGCPKNGIVLDPFMGSGTTALVARKLGRRFIGSELNPEYVDICNRRLDE